MNDKSLGDLVEELPQPVQEDSARGNGVREVRSPVSVTYDSADRGNPALRELRELLRFRALIALMIVNQLKTRYRRSAIGLGWILVQPLLSTSALSVAFSAVFRLNIPNYPIYAMTGLLAWTFFVQATTGSVEASVAGGALSNRVYIPRSTYVVAAAGGGLVNLVLGLVPLAAAMLFTDTPIPLTWVLVPAAVVFLLMFALGVGLIVATVAVIVNDVAHVYQVLVPLVFFLTPVAYPIEMVSPRLAWIVRLNPLYYMCGLFRSILSEGHLPDAGTSLIAGGSGLIVLAIGWLVFSRNSDRFAYYV